MPSLDKADALEWIAPGRADWIRDSDDLISANRLIRPTRSLSFSSTANGVAPQHASAALRGAAVGQTPAVTPSISTRNYAGGPRDPPQVGSGIGEVSTGPLGLEPAPALSRRFAGDDPGISWPRLICKTCRSEIRENEVLGIRYCRAHGTASDFLYWSRQSRSYVGV